MGSKKEGRAEVGGLKLPSHHPTCAHTRVLAHAVTAVAQCFCRQKLGGGGEETARDSKHTYQVAWTVADLKYY